MSTPNQGHGPIKMVRRLPDQIDFPDVQVSNDPGSFYWMIHEGKRYLVVALPWPSDPSKGIFTRWSIDFPNEQNAQWSWDGNEDEPTLKPSLHWVGVWHGWVTNGVLEEAK